jgi:RNA polymerase sigma-70 factor, ECF subfamily
VCPCGAPYLDGIEVRIHTMGEVTMGQLTGTFSQLWRQRLERVAHAAEAQAATNHASPTTQPSMPNTEDVQLTGRFSARYVAFLETITNLRPSLHRYCSRMTGSVLDGEDVVQDALFQAYRKLDTFDDSRPLAPWLFRIAHNRCIDFMRRRDVREATEAAAAEPGSVPPVEPAGSTLGHAVEHLVLMLPPKERACVLLKDVFDYSLEEIADLIDSTVGGVKAALNRGRSKLAALPPSSNGPKPVSAATSEVLRLYVDRFNQRDWDGLRELIAADARLQVADRFRGQVSESPYFGNYERMTEPWRMAVGEVDGEAAVIVLHRSADAWKPAAVVRLNIADGQIVEIADYWHCPWIVPAASVRVVSEPVPTTRS